MKTVSRIILPLTLLIIFGCQSSMFDGISTSDQPEWVERILGRTTNDSSLEGTWSYSSVVSYKNTECTGEGELVDFIGSVTYGETNAMRTSNEIFTFSDFEEKGYNLDEFQEICVQKGGVLNSNGDCEFTYEEPFEYYLSDGGYCETYTYDDKDGYYDDKSVTYCGSIAMEENSASITFVWESDNPGKSGCKIIELTEQ